MSLPEERTIAEWRDEMRRINSMRDELRAKISTMQLQLKAYDNYHTELTYLLEN